MGSLCFAMMCVALRVVMVDICGPLMVRPVTTAGRSQPVMGVRIHVIGNKKFPEFYQMDQCQNK